MANHGAGEVLHPRRGVILALMAAVACSGGGGGHTPNAGSQGVTVAVSPRTASIAERAQQPFVATVTGTADTSVSWSISEAGCGTVSPAGLYSAPATGATATCHVIVTSNADASKSAVAVVTVEAPLGTPPPTDTVWEPLKIGAGGWLVGMDVDPTGATYVIRTDTFGAYVSDGVKPWSQLVTASSMPASYVARFTPGGGAGGVQSLSHGVYEIRVAPSNPNVLYMHLAGRIYRSTNRGVTWADANGSGATSFSPGAVWANDAYRIWGAKMAIDPANPDVVYAGAQGGLYRTLDGGATWALVAGVPASTANSGGYYAAMSGVAIDGSSATVSGRKAVVFACSNGNGVYRSSDGGGSFSLVPGGPTTVANAAIGPDGVYYAVNRSTTLFRWANAGHPALAAGWNNTAPSGGAAWHSVALDPFVAGRLVVADDGGYVNVGTSFGNAWAGRIYPNHPRTATDVPWLSFANEQYMSNATMVFDPRVQNKLWFAQGIGVWFNQGQGGASTAWTSFSAGIEQLVGRDICAPPGSPNVITAGMDRSVFVVPRTNASYPSRYGTEATPSRAIIAAWAVDYAANNPSHLVAIVNRGLAGEPELSGYSLDGGASWTTFPTQPGSGGQAGDVVAPSIDDIIAVVGGRYAFRSTDRGNSWARLSLPGDSGADSTSLHCGANCKKHILAVDGQDPNTVYLYFYGHGLYRSTDGGATWTLVTSNGFDGGNMLWQVKLRAVPGQAGNLFLTAGQGGGATDPNPASTRLWRSRDGGATWTQVPGMAEPYDVALGKAAPGASYPAIYVVGWYNGTYGIWRSIDDAATWTQIGPFPFGSMDEINVITASQDVFGDVWVAFQGSGWGYGRLGP